MSTTASTLRSRAQATRPSSAKQSTSDDVLSSSSSESGDDNLNLDSLSPEAKKAAALKAHENDFPPFVVPNFTIKEILGAIPAHCFERSALRSSVNVVGDFAMIAALGYAASFIDSSFGSSGSVFGGVAGEVAKWAAWGAYWFAQGLVFTGVWIIGHECGHQAFSPSKTINNTVGLILHSLVLVPYHSWRISHARHHAATGHMTRDEVFVPRTASARKVKSADKAPKKMINGVELDELLEDAPLYRLFDLITQQLVGWPAYLFVNASGQKHYPAWTNHFSPSSIIFDARHRQQILLSDFFLVLALGALTVFGHYVGGFAQVVKYYGIPYLFTNHWLVMITFLQHTDPALPHYHAGTWNFQRGALCTIDRNLLGPVGPWILHGITETHVAHHISSKIPHYNAWEATEALKKFLGPHYHSTDENMFKSLWKSYRLCRYVDDEPENDVVFFKNHLGQSYRTLAPADVPSDSGVDVDDKSE